jgi:hypothetical protein
MNDNEKEPMKEVEEIEELKTMNQENETKSPVTTKPEEAINKKFFQELVEAKLPTEKIHQKIGDVDKV